MKVKEVGIYVVAVKRKRATSVKKRTTKVTKDVRKDEKGFPVLGANMCRIDFMEFESDHTVSFEFIDVCVLGQVSGTDYVEVRGIENGIVYKIDRSEFGKIETGKVGMIHLHTRSKYGYSYLPF